MGNKYVKRIAARAAWKKAAFSKAYVGAYAGRLGTSRYAIEGRKSGSLLSAMDPCFRTRRSPLEGESARRGRQPDVAPVGGASKAPAAPHRPGEPRGPQAPHRRGLRRDHSGESACKPGSVPPRNEAAATIHLGHASPHASCDLPGNAAQAAPAERIGGSPIRSCSGWGLPCRRHCCRRGALLPHLFTLTSRGTRGGIFSAALSVGSRLPGVTWHPALRSPDFPLRRRDRGPRRSGCPADSTAA